MRLGWVVASGLLMLAGCFAHGSAPGDSGATNEDDLTFRPGAIDTTLPDVDAVGYDVELSVVDDTAKKEAFSASVKGTYVATKDLTELALDFEQLAVDSVRVNGKFAEHTIAGDQIIVRFPRIARGETFSTTIAYHGSIRQADGANPDDFAAFGGFMVKQKNSEGRRIYSTLSWPRKARRWLPLRDHPRDSAMVAFTLTFPKAFTVLANGKRVSTKDTTDGKKTWRYEALTPMPVYDFHVAAYDGWKVDESRSTSGVPIATYSYGKDHKHQKTVYGDLTKAMDFFEQSFGPYRWGSAAWVQEPIFGGGMEHASVISMDETLFADPKEARTTAFHELAHHWSGNSVHFRTWNDFWLSEGFTEYLTARAVTQIDGPAAGKVVWRDYLKSALAADKTTPHALAPMSKDEIDVLTIFDAIPYQKGALVVRMLEQIVGREPMAAFLKTWFEKHGLGAAVTTDDLARELEEATKKDLSGFFATFVREPHHPELAATFTQKGSEVEIEIRQLQTAGPRGGFVFPLDVDLVDEAGQAERITVNLGGTGGKTTKQKLTTSKVVKSVVMDPDEVAIAVLSCGQSGGSCKTGFRCLPQHDGVSACIPE